MVGPVFCVGMGKDAERRFCDVHLSHWDQRILNEERSKAVIGKVTSRLPLRWPVGRMCRIMSNLYCIVAF